MQRVAQNWSARCIVCGRELSPGGDPLVCDTCPRPEVRDHDLAPVEEARATPPPPPGHLPGMAARPPGATDELAVWESLGLGFAAAAVSALIWFELSEAIDASLWFLAIGAGALIGAGFGFDARYRARGMLSAVSALVTLATIVVTTYLIERSPIAAVGDVDLVLPASDAFDLVWAVLEDEPWVLVWWVIGVSLAIRGPAVR